VILQRSTAEVRAARRFDLWREAICEVFVDLEPHSTDRKEAGGFAGELLGGQIGAGRRCGAALRGGGEHARGGPHPGSNGRGPVG
jgi:hypothetical protein